MKILLVSDIHLKNSDQFDKEPSTISDRTLYKIKRLKEIIEQEKPDILIDAGDLTDTASPDEIVRIAFFKTISPLVRKIYLVAGNHNSEKKLVAGTSESMLCSNVQIIQPGKVLKEGECTFIGYTRSKEKFLELCEQNKNKLLFTHGDIPNYPLPFDTCFFGHAHAHGQKNNCWSIGSLFKDSWAEENDPNYYCVITDKIEFKENPDLKLKTFYSIEERESDPNTYDFIRFYFKGKADILKGLNEKELAKKYGTKFFEYDIEKEEIVKEKIDDIDSAISEFIRSKNLTEEELEFGKRFLL